MKKPDPSRPTDNLDTFFSSHIVLALLSVGALTATFLVSVSNLDFQRKAMIFAATVVLYLAFYAWLVFRQNQKSLHLIKEDSDAVYNSDIEAKLLALEEANQYFGASLKRADMFRLAASRINEIIPHSTCALFTANEEKTKLKIAFAVGENAGALSGLEIKSSVGLAGKTFQSGKAQIDDKLLLEKSALPAGALENLNSAIAVPLASGAETFGVLVLYGGGDVKFDDKSLKLFEAVGSRVAPLFQSAQTFETNLTNALTDTLTNLPNERAFYLILENQIAESQRVGSERPLTILTIDIKDFDELNRRHGHAAGDRVLEYAADTIKNQLRQMDFLARASNDEFLAVMPTASEEIAREIVGRIEKAFVSKPFEFSAKEKVNLQLNFGAASFGKDGETAAQLLKHSQLRKKQSKETENNNVLWFPKEFIN